MLCEVVYCHYRSTQTRITQSRQPLCFRVVAALSPSGHRLDPRSRKCVCVWFIRLTQILEHHRDLRQFKSLYCQVLCRQSIFSAWSCPFLIFFYWHNTFVQTSFKNINKLEPLRLTWQKTHYQMSWRRTNIFRKRFTNEMSLQNIQERKVGCHTKYYQKTSKSVWYQPFQL